MNKIKVSLLALSISVVITGCGGSDSGGDSSNISVSESFTRSILTQFVGLHDHYTANDEYIFPQDDSNLVALNDTYQCSSNVYCAIDGIQPPKGMLWRYEATETNPVIVYHAVIDGEPAIKDQRVLDGMKIIEETIGRKVFLDKGFVNFNSADIADSFNINYSSVSGDGGILISVGTAPDASTPDSQIGYQCGNVSYAPYTSSLASVLVSADGEVPSGKGWSWMNLGGDTCGFDKDIVAHEFAHLLYVVTNDGHFNGFGEGNGIFDERAKAVLHTIYNNPIGMEVSNMAYTWDAK